MTNTVKKTFKLHPDQKELVDAALENIKKHTGTAFDTVALEYMAQSYIGQRRDLWRHQEPPGRRVQKGRRHRDLPEEDGSDPEEILGTTLTVSLGQ